jgi:hypothetical protein
MRIAALILVFAGVGTFVGWRVSAVTHQKVDHYGVVHDSSESFTGGCLAVVAEAEKVNSQPNSSAASTFSVVTLGDDSTASEPRLLATYSIPRTRQVIEGLHADARHRQEMYRNIWNKCISVKPVSVSPIFLAVKQSVAFLHAKGCAEQSHCVLNVHSDLQENVERTIRERIQTGHSSGLLPAPIDNRGITVSFCGLAETAGLRKGTSGHQVRQTGLRDSEREDRIRQTWRLLFTNPENVTFSPYCSAPRDPALLALAEGRPGGNR